MEKGNRPRAREKHVTEGGGNVYRREQADTGGTGPVGQGGRPTGGSTGGSTGGRPGGSTSGNRNDFGSGLNLAPRSTATGGRSLKSTLLLIVAAAIIYFVYNAISGGQGTQPVTSLESGSSGSSGSSTQSVNTSSAPGAYEPDTTVADGARAKRTAVKGGGADEYTIMVYMCGADLESRYGMGTSDLNEMINATISDKVHIVVETGGASKWQNKTVSNKTNQIYHITSDGMEVLNDDLGKKAMTDPGTLSSFIKYSKEKYPADRYALILWDHGGGSVTGYGYDENFPNGSMTLDGIGKALKDGGCTLDFIGFDACLMATLETALTVEPYADYLIGSEETEPGTGWYYTDWITKLSKDTSRSTLDIGKDIADGFVAASYEDNPTYATTLSVVDLAELSGTVPTVFNTFAKSIQAQSDNYQSLSAARGESREFAQSSRIDQVDLINLTENIGTDASNNFAKVLRSCVKYNRTNRITNANGLSVYFPYKNLSSVSSAVNTYEKIGLDEEYTKSIKSFASLSTAGQAVSVGNNGSFIDSLLGTLTGGTSSEAASGSSGIMDTSQITGLLGSLLGGGDFSSLLGGRMAEKPDWLDEELIQNSAQMLADTQFDAKSLKITQIDGKDVVELSDKQWDLIRDVELNVYLDDGQGYIDLGFDNTFTYVGDNALRMNYDKTWLAVDGQVVSYYMLSNEDDKDGGYTITGYIPARLNDQYVHLIVTFTDENPNGSIIGANPVNSTGDDAASDETNTSQADTLAKGAIALKANDKIDFICDYYTYEGAYNGSYYLGDQYVVPGSMEDIKISNVSVGADMPCEAVYRFTDYYDNTYWTPTITDTKA